MYFQQAVALTEPLGSTSRMAQSMNWLMIALARLGHYQQAKAEGLQALRLAQSVQAWPVVLDILSNMAYMVLAQNQEEALAIMLLKLVEQHPATDERVRWRCQRELENLAEQVAKAVFASAQAQGEIAHLENTIDSLIASLQALAQPTIKA